MLLVMTPWWLRSRRLTGHFVPTTLQVGASLYDGLSPQASGASNMKPVAEFERLFRERHPAEEDETPAEYEYRVDARLREAALGWLGTEPAAALRLAGTKFLRTWNVWPNEASFSAWPVRLAVAVTYLPLLLLGLAGVVRDASLRLAVLAMLVSGVVLQRLARRIRGIDSLSPAGHAGPDRAGGRRDRKLVPGRPRRGRPGEGGRRLIQGNGSVLNQGGLSAIVARLIGCCWFVFKWGLALSVVGAALAVPYFYRHLDEKISQQVQLRLAQQYPGLKVTIGSATLVKGEGISIRGLSILELGAEGPAAELLTYDECFLHCRTDLQDLLTGDLEVTQVTIRHPTLRMTHRPNGSWSTAKLLPLPKLSKRPPQVTVENGTVEIFDPLKNPSSTLTLRDINLTLTPPAGEGPSENRSLQGTVSGDYFRRVVVTGVVDPHRPGFSLTGSVEGLEICPALRDALPGAVAEKLGMLGALRGEGAAKFRVAYDPAAATPLEFNVSGRLVHGLLDDPRLPHPLTDINATVQLSNQGFAVEDLTARSNQATLRLSAHGKSLGLDQPLQVEARIRQLELDRPLLDALPEKLQQQWSKFLPEGRVDVDATLLYDGGHWYPQLTVRCLDVSFAHYKFRYRLEGGTGTVTLQDDVLQVNLMAYGGNQPVRVDARWQHPLSAPAGWMEVRGDDLPLDEKLLAALPERSRALAKSLDLHGAVSVQYNLWRQSPQEPAHQHLFARVNRCGLRYDKFSYPLANVHGTLTMTDGNWTFSGLEGTNGATRVTCEGEMTTTAAGHDLALRFRAGTSPWKTNCATPCARRCGRSGTICGRGASST